MSTAKENPCRKFQANIFNKSKCQNCFKPRELHLLTDQDLTQAKPIYGGWLCLAPEGTDFDNPMQRSRKWQRRFFVLYEHGCLRFALDESRSTLPQGTVNMNLCTDVIDAEPKTGQKNALCIITPEQEYFIRGENKEIINGWSEQLVVYPKTNKQNQKKKRKVEPATTLEPGPAKVAVTGSGIPEADPGPDSSSIIWQEELSQREVEGATVWSAADLSPLGALPPPAGDVGSDAGSLNGDEVDRAVSAATAAPLTSSAAPGGDLLSPTGSCSSLGGVPRCLSPVASDPFPSGSSLLSNGSHISGSLSSLDSDASGSTVTSNDSHPAAQRGAYSHAGLHHDTPRARRLEAEARKAEKRSRVRSPERHQRPSVLSPESRSGVIEKLEALELENAEKMEVEETEVGRNAARQGRHEHRRFNRQDQDLDFRSTRPPLRRAKSLDRRTTESVMTPDLLNFKKGWMVKLEEPGQCKKYWFVLTDHSLRYYKDSIAEEASDLDGEIELSTCYNVTEYQAQRNYGFQIHTLEGVHTLSAMTAGIRRNWIQAVMKNVRPSTAPDVASSTEDHATFAPPDGLVRPDVTQDSPPSEASSVEREVAPGHKKSRAAERRREGRSKTFDWAEFRPIAQALAQQRAQEAEGLSGDMADLERNRRREERRKRYDAAVAAAPTEGAEGARMDCESGTGTGTGAAVLHAGPEAAGAGPTERKQRVEEVIEQHWQQVEQTPLREEKRVPLPVALQPRDTAELERLLESYKKGVDDLKAQLEGCHQQLVNSSQHKQELEVQLRTALEREHDVRSGYISPLEHPMGLEADLAPQMKRAELVSSQAQSLTKKYQETKELLQLQELKKRNMQAQLGLSLSHLTHTDPCPPDAPLEGPPPEPVQKTVSFLLSDSADGIQELEELMTDTPMSLQGLLRLLQCHSCSQALGEQGHYQKLLGRWKHQQDVENETIRKSLLRAGESIRDYETRLLTMEDMVGKAQRQKSEGSYGPKIETHSNETTNDVAIGMLAQRVELLTSENGALNQRYQEIVNQLTEADREIDRLKAELAVLQGSKQHHLAAEELGRLKAELAENQASAIDREYYERELNERALRLHEALVTLEELGNTLRDTEKRLQLREATLKGLGFQAATSDDVGGGGDEEEEEEEKRSNAEQLKALLEASEAKLYEKEAIIKATERRCVELEVQKSELMIQKEEAERVVMQKLGEAGDEIRRLQERVGVEMHAGRGEPTMHVSKGAIQTCEKQVVEAGLLKQVVNEIGMKSEALSAVIEMFGHVDVNVEKMFGDLKSTLLVTDYLCSSQEDMSTVNQKLVKRLVLEAEFWSQLLTIKGSGKGTSPDFGKHVAVRMLAEKSLLFLTCRLCPPANEDGNRGIPGTEADFSAMFTWLDEKTNALILKELRQTLAEKAHLLKQMITTIDMSKDDTLRSLALKTFGSDGQQKPPSEYLLDALKDAYMLYVSIRLQLENERELMHTQAELQTGTVDCCNCPKLRATNRDLNSKLTDLQNRLSEAMSSTNANGEPIDSLDKTTELRDMIARHRKELLEVKDVYEQEAEALRKEVVKASEALRLISEENVQEVDSLTARMENMRKKHDAERSVLLERFEGEMDELRSVVTPLGPAAAAAAGSGETPSSSPSGQAPPQTLNLKERIQELVTQVTAMTVEMRRREQQGDATALRRKYETDLEHLKATCERGFAAMEDSHQRVVDELQRKHQRELENLQEEKDRLLAEETAATIAAIEAMRNAHRSELEKELEKARKTNNHAENADLDEIHRQHEEELCSFQREIEVLSEQYSQKCLENAHLAQALEAERQALRQCQRENQELNAHNQELNNRLAAEITKMRSMASEDGDSGVGMQGKELYELEVMLRVKESEVQYLKQEINSLKDELQAAQRDKKYATDKYKDIYTELSIVKAKAERDLGRLRDQLQLAHEALGEPSLEEVERGGYDIMKSKSNPDILKMAAAAAKRSERTLRSKSLKEGLTAEQRLHLFDNKDTKEF